MIKIEPAIFKPSAGFKRLSIVISALCGLLGIIFILIMFLTHPYSGPKSPMQFLLVLAIFVASPFSGAMGLFYGIAYVVFWIKSGFNDPAIHNNRGVKLADDQKYEEAITEFNNAMEIGPEVWVIYSNRAEAYNLKGDSLKAIDDYSKSMELNKFVPENYFNRGSIYFVLRDLEKAIVDLNKAIELKNDIVSAYYLRGLIFMTKQNYNDSIQDFNKTLSINPNYKYSIYSLLGIAYEAVGELDKALVSYQNFTDRADANKDVKLIVDVNRKLSEIGLKILRNKYNVQAPPWS